MYKQRLYKHRLERCKPKRLRGGGCLGTAHDTLYYLSYRQNVKVANRHIMVVKGGNSEEAYLDKGKMVEFGERV